MCIPHPGTTHATAITEQNIRGCIGCLEETLGGDADDVQDCLDYLRSVAVYVGSSAKDTAS